MAINIADLQEKSSKLLEKLINKNLIISCAESCSGGLLSFILTSPSGASQIFKQSYITYSNEAKNQILGIDNQVFIDHGAVSENCANLMAKSVSNLTNCDIAIAISGIAGPNCDSSGKEIGLVFISICHKNSQPKSYKFNFQGDRNQVRIKAVDKTLSIIDDTVIKL